MELLAPAGDMQKLKMALSFGADAVYFAGKKFGLRTFAGNFDESQLAEAIEYVHSKGKKAYITVNVMPRDSDMREIVDYCKHLHNIKADAVIIADLGVFCAVRREVPDLEVHISTQANVVNSETANAYYNMGAKRIVLARELTLDQIKEIRANTPKDLELEAFVHGAMCISYSGRCLLSNFFTNRDANAGACVQACRWCYELREVSRENTNPIEEDSHGTYILNSYDICMIEYLDKLAQAGITSLKIEGRMKTEYYVANVVNAYRHALDLYNQDPQNYVCPPELRAELDKSSHRGYSTGFYLDGKSKVDLVSNVQTSTHIFVGVVLEDSVDGRAKVQMRNRFYISDELEVLSPYSLGKSLKMTKIVNDKGDEIDDVKVVMQEVYIYTDTPLHKNDILRKKL
ncbi:MAG: peptidase U32 family protein [Clostridia bacterium]